MGYETAEGGSMGRGLVSFPPVVQGWEWYDEMSEYDEKREG